MALSRELVDALPFLGLGNAMPLLLNLLLELQRILGSHLHSI